RPTPIPTSHPYTTVFRSRDVAGQREELRQDRVERRRVGEREAVADLRLELGGRVRREDGLAALQAGRVGAAAALQVEVAEAGVRSVENTVELESLRHVVC